MIDWRIGDLYETRCGLIVRLEVIDLSCVWPLIFEVKGQKPITEIYASMSGRQSMVGTFADGQFVVSEHRKPRDHPLDILYRVEINRYPLDV